MVQLQDSCHLHVPSQWAVLWSQFEGDFHLQRSLILSHSEDLAGLLMQHLPSTNGDLRPSDKWEAASHQKASDLLRAVTFTLESVYELPQILLSCQFWFPRWGLTFGISNKLSCSCDIRILVNKKFYICISFLWLKKKKDYDKCSGLKHQICILSQF